MPLRILTLLLIISTGLSAQQRTIVGRILSSENKTPIDNANVAILGSKKSTSTNHLGFFRLEMDVGDSSSLLITHIGFIPSKVDLPDSDQFTVLLSKEYIEITPIDLAYFISSLLEEKHEITEQQISDEMDAQYRGGWERFYNDLGSRLVQAEFWRMIQIDTLIVNFTVNELGKIESIYFEPNSIDNTKILESILMSLNDWNPAKQNGNPVSQHFRLPVTFTEVFTIVEEPAEPIGGMNDFYRGIADKIKYPDKARKKLIGGKVFVEFIIERDGSITNPKIIRGIGYGCDEEAIRVVSSSPKWKPGLQWGKPVRQRMVLPIIFRISGGTFVDNSLMDSTERVTQEALYNFIGSNIVYPASARRTGTEGWVFVKFRIDSLNHEIINLVVVNDAGEGCADEVVRVLLLVPGSILEELRTTKSCYGLPVGFGLGREISGSYMPIGDNETELLPEVFVTAMGIERNRRVSNTSAYSSSPPPRGTIPIINESVFTSFELALSSKRKVFAVSVINNEDVKIPKEIAMLKHLKFLDLENDKIEALPDELAKLSNLEELYLRKNELKNLPESFSNLNSLRILGLADNAINSFPMQLINMESLGALDLSGNGLNELPHEIGQMTRLRQLFLKNNNLKELPKEIYNLKKLKRLYLQGNPIDPNEIKNLRNGLKKTEVFFEE